MERKLNNLCTLVNKSLVASDRHPVNNLFMGKLNDKLSYERLCELAKLRLGIDNQAALSRAIGASVQVLQNWKAGRGVPPVRYPKLANLMNLTIDQVLGRAPITGPQNTRQPGTKHAGDQRAQEEEDLLIGYWFVPEDLRITIWDLIDADLRRRYPSVAAAMGPRNVGASLAAERNAIAQRIIAASRISAQSPQKKGPNT